MYNCKQEHVWGEEVIELSRDLGLFVEDRNDTNGVSNSENEDHKEYN